MATATINFSFARGDEVTPFTLTCVKGGVDYDFTGATLTLTAKKQSGADTFTVANSDFTISDNEITPKITTAKTQTLGPGEYDFDVVSVKGDERITWANGILVLIINITAIA